MADDSTLTAYLVPRLTKQVENAATDALSYILNRSNGSMQALNDLLRVGWILRCVFCQHPQLPPDDGVTRAENTPRSTTTTYETGS